MTDLKIINERGPEDKPYIAGLNGKQVGIYADSLYAAKQLAVVHFQPKKRDAGLLWVELADESNPINLR